MFGLGKKDKDGRQVRIEHRSKHVRASRTGGVAARVEKKIGPVNATANTSKGIRLSTRVARGTHVALQSGRFRLIGRWKAGPMGFNLSKSGASASLRTQTGTLNFIKPQYSSFKVAGVQVRGRKAAYAQIIVMLLMVAGWLAVLTFRLAVFLSWIIYLVASFVFDFIKGFIKGSRSVPTPNQADNHNNDPTWLFALNGVNNRLMGVFRGIRHTYSLGLR
ncbi:hypothetical protein NHF40_11105 [Maricaulaceae bacterium EIL42A08]|nr:hypothetical protein [Maricaulaceae bacterium EIL42A08]